MNSDCVIYDSVTFPSDIFTPLKSEMIAINFVTCRKKVCETGLGSKRVAGSRLDSGPKWVTSDGSVLSNFVQKLR